MSHVQVYPNCMKAHIHMGRAHIGLKEYTEARECFKRAQTCDPKKEALINGRHLFILLY